MGASGDPVEDSPVDEKDAQAQCAKCLSTPERCIFCLSLDGRQYVPLHHESSAPASARLPYSTALASHAACAKCWADWEEHLPDAHKCPQCPVCQRAIDIGQGYADQAHCQPCLEDLLAEVRLRRQQPRKETKRACRCCWLWALLPVVLLIAVFNVAFSVVLDLTGRWMAKELEQHPALLRQHLPPGAATLLCTEDARDLLEACKLGTVAGEQSQTQRSTVGT
ncbi:unnamed protein product [Symbiodinium pilosum]|uniref:Uncharacterized protein n=1 Tax=Symbiodinium pilosum TaxID=2952 RepID=A0A812VKQ9_SYMPI|nr:unnamed protein product [Symbiodinium pilosum]